MRTIMAGLAEFERDLIRERVKSGLPAAKARGVVLGRKEGQRPSDKKAKKVLDLHREGLSYRLIGRNVGLSKNTVMDIVRRVTGVRATSGENRSRTISNETHEVGFCMKSRRSFGRRPPRFSPLGCSKEKLGARRAPAG